MQAAADNAKKLSIDLTIQYNRARQAAITEITVAGCKCVVSQKVNSIRGEIGKLWLSGPVVDVAFAAATSYLNNALVVYKNDEKKSKIVLSSELGDGVVGSLWNQRMG